MIGRLRIVHLDTSRDAAAALAERVAALGLAVPVRTTVQHAADLDADALRPDEVVALLVDPSMDAEDASSLACRLEERGMGVAVHLDRDDAPPAAWFGGALVTGRGTPPERLAALVAGMAHRQAEIGHLQREVALAQRFQGGLEGEITRIHDELQLAAMVQREFLPGELPALHGVEFAALWRPAHYVSGDIYAVQKLDDDHVGIFIADCVGHGVPAALMTMLIMRSLRMRGEGDEPLVREPCDVLAEINDSLVRRQGGTTRFATAVCAVVDCRRREMRLAGAGHPPPILIGVDGTVEEIETEGGLLGIFPGSEYPQVERSLDLESRLLLHSDGFEQAFPDDAATTDHERRKPTTNYRTEFARLGAEPTAESMIGSLASRLDDQTGSLHQIDDLTLLCMRCGRIGAPIGESLVESR